MGEKAPRVHPAKFLSSRGPSFMFIGAAKSGSTWFAEILREHPEVFLPPNRSTYFFSALYDMGLAWYEGFFPENNDGRVPGEVCHDYLISPEALARIREYRPGMQLVCCLRNPYERAISAWHFYARNGLDHPTLAEHAVPSPGIFDHGYYSTHLEVVRRLFPENQVLIFLFEEIRQSAESVAKRLYEFIGVDPNFVPPSLHVRVNGNSRPRSRLLANVVHTVHMKSWGRSRLASNVVGKVKQIRPIRRLVTGALYKEERASNGAGEFFGEFPDDIVERYEREISALERMLGRDLSSWRAPLDVRMSASK